MNRRGSTRREFLRNAGLGATAAVLASAGLSLGTRRAHAATRRPSPGGPLNDSSPEVEVIVGDVLGFELETDAWEGPYGWVKFRIYEAWFNGESAYYIRTDASDPTFAEENRLVWVPLLNAALSRDGATSKLYLFENGAEGQMPVISTTPEQEDYTPAWRVHTVTFSGAPTLLASTDEIEAAAQAGEVTVEPQNLVVNYPLVRWPGGELPVDTTLIEPLGEGPLVAPVDIEKMEVRFKLHQCFPGSRYIVTDTSAVPMAPMMSIVGSAPTQLLREIGAADKIWVFGNGIAGSGVMGFQPAIFRNEPGTPAWSPFWDHFVITWNDPGSARVLRSAADVQAALDAGEIEVFNGTPDTHPDGFVVNCPVPIKARNTFGEE